MSDTKKLRQTDTRKIVNIMPWDSAKLEKNTTPLKPGDRVTVTIRDIANRPIITNDAGRVFEIKVHDGQLGIDWNERQPVADREGAFIPLVAFAPSVDFVIVDVD